MERAAWERQAAAGGLKGIDHHLAKHRQQESEPNKLEELLLLLGQTAPAVDSVRTYFFNCSDLPLKQGLPGAVQSAPNSLEAGLFQSTL